MKLLLLQPPVEDFYDTDVRLQPLGLAYLAAAVKKHLPAVQVQIADFHHGYGRRTVPLPGALKYLRPYYPFHDQSPFSTFYQYYHFGASADEIVARVSAFEPDLVGISSLFTAYFGQAEAVARLLKQKLGLPVLMGGAHVSAMPAGVLASPWVDYIITGEGELPLVEFLKEWQAEKNWQQVPALGYKADGAAHFNPPAASPPLEELPLPDFSGFALSDYQYEKKPMCFVITSRSCPYHCSFCSVHITHGRKYRRRPVAGILAEIDLRYQQGYRVIDFEDDNLTFHRQSAVELFSRLAERFAGGEVEFLAMNGLSYQNLDSQLLQLMRRANFTHLNLALVSSNPALKKKLRRPGQAGSGLAEDLEKFDQIIDQAFALGFKTVVYQIVGLPGETLQSMTDTLAFAAQRPVLLGASLFYRVPGVELEQSLPPANAEDWQRARLTAMAVETADFKRQEIYTLFVATRIFNFLKSLPLPAGHSASFSQLVAENVFWLKQLSAREKQGLLILSRLLAENRLYGLHNGQMQVLPMFEANLFAGLWQKTRFLATQSGGRLFLE